MMREEAPSRAPFPALVDHSGDNNPGAIAPGALRIGGTAPLYLAMLLAMMSVGLMVGPGAAEAIERRKPQFLTEPSYLIFPLPYSLPGIGSGIMVLGLAGNIAETNIDFFGLVATGDAEGLIFGLEDIHLVSETLTLDLGYQAISKAIVNNYATRGMDSDPDDFTLMELSQVDTLSAALTLSLFDRRLELFVGLETQEVTVPRMRDKDGNVITELSPPFSSKTETSFFGAMVDYTDDRQDPRNGLRVRVQRSNTPNDDLDDPEFSVWNYGVTWYLPLGKLNTLAFHYFRSDADVRREGNTDPVAIEADLGIDCGADAVCQKTVQELVNMFIDQRKNGSSASLGGDMRLRSYPMGRFQGAHTI